MSAVAEVPKKRPRLPEWFRLKLPTASAKPADKAADAKADGKLGAKIDAGTVSASKEPKADAAH